MVSQPTILRHLWALGYRNDVPKPVPMLTEQHKKKRLEWARKHLHDNWDTTFFLDETVFQLFRNTIGQWHKGSRPIRRVPKDRRKIFAWGGFCKEGKVGLFCFKNTMNAEFYISILEKNIADINILLGEKWRFQQDNDPKYMSRLAKSYLESNVPEVIDWPSNSPDLNPVENLWNQVKRNVEKRNPKNLGQLESLMGEEWDLIPDDTLKSLIDSMKKRCMLVIQSNGDTIDY